MADGYNMTTYVSILIIILFAWYMYKSNRKSCSSCSPHHNHPLTPTKVKGRMSNPRPVGGTAPDVNFGSDELSRDSYLNKRENDYNQYMGAALSAPNNLIENNGVDDRFGRPFLGSYVPSETSDYTNLRPTMSDSYYSTGLAADREDDPYTYRKNSTSVARDSEIDPFKDVIVDKPRDLESIDTTFSPTYLTTTKGQSYDLRADIPPSINPKFIRTRDEDDYDQLRGARLPEGRGPLIIAKPVRTYVA